MLCKRKSNTRNVLCTFEAEVAFLWDYTRPRLAFSLALHHLVDPKSDVTAGLSVKAKLRRRRQDAMSIESHAYMSCPMRA